MTDSLIFDVDGTLWDSTPVVEQAWNQAARDSGMTDVKITAAQLKGLFGLPMPEIIETVLPGRSREEREAFAPFCYRYEHEYLSRQPGVVYPELEETLQKLEKKYPLFVVSNCQAGYIELLFEKTGFGPYFKDHLCLGDTNLFKADNIRLIMERHGLKAPVYIGDTQMDADACREANVPICFAAYGFGTVKDPDYVINEPADLCTLFL
ncbi:MAG: HAD family hydrolase [Lachnospiraceae bacterium]|nr:HAD family hydrolase [Lachnospiraceae bacterium]